MTLQQVNQNVWAFRNEWHEHWPTPSVIESIRYAGSEAGEVLGEYQRVISPHHARNNAHEARVEEEAADVAIMLCTVLGENYEFCDKDAIGYNDTPDGIFLAVAKLMLMIPFKSTEPIYWIVSVKILAENALKVAMKFTSVEAVKAKLEKTYKKHVEPKL